MHIGFDISQTGGSKAGCGYFAHAMIQALLELAPQHQYSLFPSFGNFYFDSRMPLRNPYSGKNVHYGPRHLTRKKAHNFWSDPKVEASLGKPDIVQSNNFWCPTKLRTSRLIYTLHDMAFAVEPAWTTEANRQGCFNGVFQSAIVADWIVAVSDASRSHYLKVFPHFPEDRVRVIYPCSRFSDGNAQGERPKILEKITPGRFWLSVGTIEPRKNQRSLAEAYARYLALGGEPMPLVLAGGKGWLMEDFQAHLVDLGVSDQVMMIGYVSDDELVWLYRNCYANLYPSLFEGFGLPVLEGMQFGAPTLTSNSSSLPEVAGNAGILLNPKDSESWAQSMLRLSGDAALRTQLSHLARERAAQFSWKDSASSLLQLYEEAIDSPRLQEHRARI